MRYLITWLAAVGVTAGASVAGAAEFDGSVPVLCSTIDAIECLPGGDCARGGAESINAPQFMKVEFAENQIRTTREGGTSQITQIKSLEHLDGLLILQVIEGTLGWTMTIAEATGKMTVTATGDQVGFIVFGACTPL